MEEGIEVTQSPGVELSGTLSIQVDFDTQGHATNAQATLQLQGDGTFTVDLTAKAKVKAGEFQGSVEGGAGVTVKRGEVLSMSKDLSLTAAEKKTLTDHKDTVEPVRAGYYLKTIIGALKENRHGPATINLYGDADQEGNVHGKLNVETVDIAQGSVTAGVDHQHLQKSWTYDPDSGFTTNTACEKAAA